MKPSIYLLCAPLLVATVGCAQVAESEEVESAISRTDFYEAEFEVTARLDNSAPLRECTKDLELIEQFRAERVWDDGGREKLGWVAGSVAGALSTRDAGATGEKTVVFPKPVVVRRAGDASDTTLLLSVVERCEGSPRRESFFGVVVPRAKEGARGTARLTALGGREETRIPFRLDFVPLRQKPLAPTLTNCREGETASAWYILDHRLPHPVTEQWSTGNDWSALVRVGETSIGSYDLAIGTNSPWSKQPTSTGAVLKLCGFEHPTVAITFRENDLLRDDIYGHSETWREGVHLKPAEATVTETFKKGDYYIPFNGVTTTFVRLR